MPTRNISFTAEQDAFIDEAVRAGKFQNASEAVRAAIDCGIADIERGDFTDVAGADLHAFLDSLTADEEAAATASN